MDLVYQLHLQVTPCYTTNNNQADYPPETYWPYIWSISSCISTFPGVGVVIIRLKANLSSTVIGLPTETDLGKNHPIKNQNSLNLKEKGGGHIFAMNTSSLFQ